MRKINKTICYSLFAILILLSCKKEKTQIETTKFYYTHSVPKYEIHSGNQIFYDLDFKLIKSKDKTVEIKNILISYPSNFEKFSLKDSSVCKFEIIIKRDKNRIRRSIKKGTIEAYNINDSLMEIKLDVEGIGFKGLVLKNNRKYTGYFKG